MQGSRFAEIGDHRRDDQPLARDWRKGGVGQRDDG